MVNFHYIICNIPNKDKYHVKKLVFINKKLESSDDFFLSEEKVNNLKSEFSEDMITEVNESKIDLNSFLKSINLFCP
tara:strand:+ start:835 stop:1065 length:231 start_codon:yes stop_codon:yes gene_type:complete